MDDRFESLAGGEPIPRISVMENEIQARRPLIDVVASLFGWLAVLLLLAGPATAAYMVALELGVGPGLFIMQACALVPAVLAWAFFAWLRDRALARVWAKETGFGIRFCSLTAEEAQAISERYDPMPGRHSRVTLRAEGDPRGSYRGVLLIGRPRFGTNTYRCQFVAVGYSA